MDFLTAMKISGSALTAQRARLNITAMNIANANTTRTLEGGPYRAKSVILGARPVERSFLDTMESVDGSLRKVDLVEVVEDSSPFKEVFDPGHPDANEEGIVRMPNVDVSEQMIDMIEAQRAYEANVTALDAAKSMAMKALGVGG